MQERITRDEIIRIYNVELSFLDSLEESGLLHPEMENNIKYIVYEELPALERFVNWHYDLEVNLPGIEVIQNLLQQMDALRTENRRLLKEALFRGRRFDEEY
ncbi:MAG: MerR family transcriptional regulator [Chryseobacterium sp.]|nr:MAG: MerR family transcriptional regulator [Chryseobacterium sp.]